jgi:hypothetical protein
MFEFFILKAIHYNIIVVQALDRIYNVTFQASDLYTLHPTAEGLDRVYNVTITHSRTRDKQENYRYYVLLRV